MAVSGAYTYTLSGSNATITDYSTAVGGYAPTIPTTLDGYAVVAIEYRAFYNKALTSVTINHAINMGGECFKSNGNIAVTLNANVTTTGRTSIDTPFETCTIGNGLTITSNVTSIPAYLFYACGLTSLSIPTSVTSIGANSFQGNSITSITFSHVVDLKAECFKGNGNIAVTIDADVTASEGSSVNAPFEACTIGAGLTITSNATTIPAYIFYGCGLTSVVLPSTVTNVGDSSFAANTGLANFYVYNNSVTFGTNVLQNNMSASPKGTIYGGDPSNTKTWWTNNYTGTYNFSSSLSSAPSVTSTSPATNLTTSSADVAGNVTSDGGATITQRGFCYGTSANPTTSGSKKTVSGTTGSYSTTITGLSEATTYHFRAYAINAAGTSYGADVEFTTASSVAAPTVTTTSPATNVSQYTASVAGNVTSDGNSAITSRGFCYGTSANPTTAGDKVTVSGTTGAMSAVLTGLIANTTYHFRAYAINAIGTSYGADVSFTTSVAAYPQTTATIMICDFAGTISAETGTVENEIDIAGHSYNVDDFIVNTTRNNTSRRILVTTSNSVVVSSISGQTGTDIIRTYKFTDHTDKLKDASLQVNKKIQEDTEANFTLICPPTYIPRAGQYVKIITNGTHVFTGFLRSVNRRLPQNGISERIFCDCNCITLNAIPPRRTVVIAYDIGTTASDIVTSMVDDFLVDEGIAAGTINQGAILSDDWVDDALSIGDILDSLADQSGYQWMIDKNFELQFYQDPTTVSTYTATLSDLTTSTFTDFRNVVINETIDNYNNKAFYVGSTDDRGNLIIVNQETTASTLEVQNYAAGTGVYGNVVRDSNMSQHQFFTATAGTTESTIVATGIHEVVDVGDMVYNVDGYERRNVLAVTTDTLTVDAITGQTQGQTIVTYQQINDVVDNHLKKQDQVHRRLEFDSFHTDFEAGQRLDVVLSLLSVTTTESYVIDEVSITDRGANYFVAHVVADKRNPNNFSTQRTPNYKDYYRQF